MMLHCDRATRICLCTATTNSELNQLFFGDSTFYPFTHSGGYRHHLQAVPKRRNVKLTDKGFKGARKERHGGQEEGRMFNLCQINDSPVMKDFQQGDPIVLWRCDFILKKLRHNLYNSKGDYRLKDTTMLFGMHILLIIMQHFWVECECFVTLFSTMVEGAYVCLFVCLYFFYLSWNQAYNLQPILNQIQQLSGVLNQQSYMLQKSCQATRRPVIGRINGTESIISH